MPICNEPIFHAWKRMKRPMTLTEIVRREDLKSVVACQFPRRMIAKIESVIGKIFVLWQVHKNKYAHFYCQ